MESLRVLTQAFEREEQEAQKGGDGAVLAKTKSETEFDKIERDEVSPERAAAKRSTSSGNWMPWAWGAKPDDAASEKKHEDEDSAVDVPAQGKSSGIDLGH
jgi:hypothetical protein